MMTNLAVQGKHWAHCGTLWVKSRSVGMPKGLGILRLVTLGCKNTCEVKIEGIVLKHF